jgi:hypothetical protein
MSLHARTGDPWTSHAAVPKNITAQMIRVLKGYRDGVMRTDHDAYAIVSMDVEMNGARQRCTDLRHAGFIERVTVDGVLLRGKTPSGKYGYLCRITPAGRDYLNKVSPIKEDISDIPGLGRGRA